MSRARTGARRSRPRSRSRVAILARLAALDGACATAATSRRSRRSSREFQDIWLFSQFGDARRAEPDADRLLGFAIAVVVGIALGIPLGLSALARRLAMPHIEYWRAMPPPALLPISIILLALDRQPAEVAFIAFFCIFPVLLNTIDGVARHRPDAARHGTLVRRRRGANGSARIVLPGRAAADLRRHADEPLAGA